MFPTVLSRRKSAALRAFGLVVLGEEFKLGSDSVETLSGVGLVVQLGEMVSIVGPSGSGKSTL